MTLYECSRCSRRSAHLFAGDVAEGDLCLPCLRASMRMTLDVGEPWVELGVIESPVLVPGDPAREVAKPPLA